jgi:Fe-S cluster biogenesis protein NfuA
MDLLFRMHAERTPNPHSIKWVLGRAVVEGGGSAHFESRPPVGVSPLAARLFEIDGVTGVFFASNFVTVTKREDVEWIDVAQAVVDTIKQVLGDGGSALGPDFEAPTESPASGVVERIRRILEDEVRPAVAMDGGDIAFLDFKDGVVELSMHGSCSGCPGSTATLKQGIEARLREAVPEVRAVVAV